MKKFFAIGLIAFVLSSAAIASESRAALTYVVEQVDNISVQSESFEVLKTSNIYSIALNSVEIRILKTAKPPQEVRVLKITVFWVNQ